MIVRVCIEIMKSANDLTGEAVVDVIKLYYLDKERSSYATTKEHNIELKQQKIHKKM